MVDSVFTGSSSIATMETLTSYFSILDRTKASCYQGNETFHASFLLESQAKSLTSVSYISFLIPPANGIIA